jgi:lipid II:glycine glycyltransferase (peptidoglycan interpeptide bridge formation enzyme)
MMNENFQIEVDGQTCESWSKVIAQFADASIYQSWAYGTVRWGERNLSHLILKRDGQIVAAAQLRIVRPSFLPMGIAYLRWGPLCQRKGEALNPEIARKMSDCLRDEYSRRRKLALQVLPNAYTGSSRSSVFDEALSQSSLKADLRKSSYRTILVDLSPDVAAIRKRLDQKWRNQLNRSEKNGLQLEVNDGREGYREFMLLYEPMWERKRFKTSVDVEEFDRIRELLTDSEKMKIFLAKEGDRSIGALVFSLMGDTGIYLLGANNERARELKAAYYLQWQTMLWLKEQGANWYDLGGIDPEANPGGYHFKKGMSGLDAAYMPSYISADSWLHRGASTLSNLYGRFKDISNSVLRRRTEV